MLLASTRSGRADPLPPPSPDRPIAVIAWPDDGAARRRAAAAGLPRLLVIAAGESPPTDCGRHEDWCWADDPPADRAARCRRLAAGPRPSMLVAPVVASTLDEPALHVLDALAGRTGLVVTADDLIPHDPPDDDRLDAILDVLDRALAATGHAVHRARGGAVLVVVDPTLAAAGAGAVAT